MIDDSFFMELALEEAKKADAENEVPVGAVLVNESSKILSRGYNRPMGTNDPTAHAEIVAIREAASDLKNYRLPGSILYVTLEPCLMCWGAIIQARIKRVVFGASDVRYSAAVSRLVSVESVYFNHKPEVNGGVLESECAHILRRFFERKRKHNT